jgi:hypothetical protein
VANNKNRKIIRWIVIIIAAVVLWFFYNWGGNLLTPIAVKQIKLLTGARVDIGNIKFKLSGRIRLENIKIGPLIPAEPDNAILTAKNLDAYFSLWSLLKFSPKIDQLVIRDFTINAQFNNDTKQWNILALKLPAGKGSPPDFRFKRGEFKFTQISGGKEIKTIDFRVRNVSTKIEHKKDLNILTIAEADATKTTGDRILVRMTKGQTPQIEVEGNLATLDFNLFGSKCNFNSLYSKVVSDGNSITFEKANLQFGPRTIIDVNGAITDLKNDPAFVFGVRMKDLDVRHDPANNCFAHGSRIFEKFIPLLQVFFDNFNPQGLLDLDVVLTGKAKQIAKTHCNGYLGCKDISIRYFEFPYLVEHMAGRIDVTETSMTMQNLKAAHGKVDITMKGYCDGFGPTMKSRVVLSSGNMLLDNDLYTALLEYHKKLWYIFSPAGAVSGDFIYTASPPNIRKMEIYANLLDVSIMCQYFPYRISGIRGKFAVDSNVIDLKDVVSQHNGGTIKMQGRITNASSTNPVYDFKIQAQDIAINDELMNAFPAEQKKFFNDFEIQAKGDADIYIHSVNNVEMPVDYLAKLKLRGDFVKHPLLPEQLKNITLDANLTPWTFDIGKFNATFRGNAVNAAGTIWTGADKKPVGYCVRLAAMNLELDSNTVTSVLGQDKAKMLEDFKFTGNVNLEATLGKNSRVKCPEFEIAVECLNDTAFLNKLNMPLENLTGKIIIRPEDIEFASLSATPADSNQQAEKPPRITLDGKLKLVQQEVEYADLKLNAEGLNLDEKLTPFLGNVADFYTRAEPAGTFGLNFNKIKFYKDQAGEKRILLDGSILLNNCSIGQDKPITNIYAICNVDAEYKLTGGLERCNLFLNFQNIDIKDRTLKNLKVPVVIDTNENKVIIENFAGDFLGGKISGNAIAETDANSKFSKYEIDMAMADVHTESFVSPKTADKTPGQTNAELHLRGSFQNPQNNIGRFIAEAKGIKPKQAGIVGEIRTAIYEAVERDLALDNASIQAVIKGKVIQISRFDIYGPTASLRGTGTYLPGSDVINVNFTAYGAAGKEEPGFIESLTAGFGPAFLTVDLTGSLESPRINVTPVPIIKNTLEGIGTKTN